MITDNDMGYDNMRKMIAVTSILVTDNDSGDDDSKHNLWRYARILSYYLPISYTCSVIYRPIFNLSNYILSTLNSSK